MQRTLTIVPDYVSDEVLANSRRPMKGGNLAEGVAYHRRRRD